MAKISASVGLHGINKPNDVRIIQGSLNRVAAVCGGPETKLATDGKATGELFSIISRFQARFFGTLKPDAKVDVKENTYKALARQLQVKRMAVYLSKQEVEVVENGCGKGTFLCVTGDYQFPTERGEFKILTKRHPYRSKKYNVQMNYAMFFTSDGKAIHQYHGLSPLWLVRFLKMNSSDWFGSHGCVRLEEQDAKALYEWVTVGTRVTVY
jgi:lipoprotein-anchoring transpeptidase ErfK/SrfK